ncbi:hypothetical protein [Aquamicrobium terrae]|uniref:Uncharacterized protein n=1 Tax=Aquamicrobium terrae TaxID=1324945 RepID=A0ABV2MWT4_9HYPH
MTKLMPDPNDPQPTPDNPNPAPARPPTPPETPQPDQPPSVPPPSPDPIPSPNDEPVQIPPDTPSEVPPQPEFPGPTAMRAWGLVVVLLGCVAAISPTAAQISDNEPEASDKEPEVTEPMDRCQAQPDGEKQADAERDDQHANNAPRPELDDCNGVLTPPKTGDGEMEEQPPDTGTTPVIPPEAVPGQPPG